MQPPDPNVVRVQLSRFLGTWKGEETMTPAGAPEPATSEGLVVTREGMLGHGVILDHTMHMNGQPMFESHAVLMYDHQAEEVVMHMFDGTGLGRDEWRGTWSGDVLTMTAHNAMGHWRITYDFSETGHMRSKVESGNSPDEMRQFFAADYVRQG